MRAEVEKQLFSDQLSCPAVVQRHFDRLRLDYASGAHDEFRPSGFVAIEMKRDQAVDHVALALQEPSSC